MAKCKKGKIWDNKIKKCRVPSTNEKRIMNRHKEDVKTAKNFGTMTGAAAGATLGSKTGVGGMALGTIVGGLYGRAKSKKSVNKKYKKAGIKVPSRRKK